MAFMDHKIYYYRSPQSLEQQSAAQWGVGAAGTIPARPVPPAEAMPQGMATSRGSHPAPQNSHPSAKVVLSSHQRQVPTTPPGHSPCLGTPLGAGRGQLSPPPWGRMGLTPELLARARLYGDFQSLLKAAGEPEGETRSVCCELGKKKKDQKTQT